MTSPKRTHWQTGYRCPDCKATHTLPYIVCQHCGTQNRYQITSIRLVTYSLAHRLLCWITGNTIPPREMLEVKDIQS